MPARSIPRPRNGEQDQYAGERGERGECVAGSPKREGSDKPSEIPEGFARQSGFREFAAGLPLSALDERVAIVGTSGSGN